MTSYGLWNTFEGDFTDISTDAGKKNYYNVTDNILQSIFDLFVN